MEKGTHAVRVLGLSAIFLVAGAEDQRVAAVAGRQRGRINRQQLLSVGLTSHQIDRRIRTGRLLREHPGVYAVGHRASAELSAETAALLAAPRGATLCRHSAALVWRIPCPPGAAVHLLSPGLGHRPRPGIAVHATRRTDPRGRVVDGLPVTSVPRTLVDLAPELAPRLLERALEDALIRRLTTEAALTHTVASLHALPGALTLRRLLTDRGGPTWTRAESEECLLALIRSAGLPPPAVNARIGRYEVDFTWPELRLAIELDGYAFHSSRAAFERDRRKGNEMAAMGITLLRVTWRRIADDPIGLAAEVTAAVVRAQAA